MDVILMGDTALSSICCKLHRSHKKKKHIPTIKEMSLLNTLYHHIVYVWESLTPVRQ